MNGDPETEKFLYSLISCVAGAITSLSFRSYKEMSFWEVAMALFVAASFAFFVGPLVLSKVEDPRTAGAGLYLLATGSNVLIPKAVKLATGWFGGASDTEKSS